MRCPNCNTPNDEGAAVCEQCGEPLTAYGGQITGLVSEETRAKAARLAVRPPVVPIMTALDAVGALWPLRAILAAFSSRTTLNADSTNYLGAAFGALGATVTAAVMLPLALALLLLAWATWTQRPWAWIGNAALLALFTLLSVLALPSSPFLALARIALALALARYWLRPDTKEWFGVQ